MQYNLGEYRFDNGAIYKIKFGLFPVKIASMITTKWRDGVRVVNTLCGIKEVRNEG